MKIDGIDMGRTEPLNGGVLKAQPQAADKEKIGARKAAREFEALFVGMMLKSMRETVGKDMLTGKGQGEDIYRSLLDQEYAKSIAEQGGLGLAKTIEKQLLEPRYTAAAESKKASEGDAK